mgnify:CR=1 FL=1
MADDFDIDIDADDLFSNDDLNDIGLDDFGSDDSDVSSSSSDEAIAPSLDKYKILIIDDDRWIQRIFSQYLNSWGFTHVQASDAFEGLDLTIKEKPLIVFLDIIMPDVSGDITLKFIRNIESIKNTPVVIISGNLNKDVLKNTYRDGASGFISKPFTKDVLLQKVMEVLPKPVYNRMIKDNVLSAEARNKIDSFSK